MFPLGSAHAEGWAPPAADVVGAPVAGAHGDVGLAGSYALGLVPPFRSSDRDRVAIGVESTGWIGPHVRLGIAWDWLVDFPPAAEPVSGPGDVRLATSVCALRTPLLSTGLGWAVKLPDADNREELGTDETDVDFGAWLGVHRGAWSATGSVGLAVLGNPLRFAEQDDVPHARLEGAWTHDALRATLFGDVALATTRNPLRAEAGGAFRFGRMLFGEAEVAAGLSPAAADARVTLRVGYRWALPRPPPGE